MSDEAEEEMQRRWRDAAGEGLPLFAESNAGCDPDAAKKAEQEVIESADASVRNAPYGDVLVALLVNHLVTAYPPGSEFGSSDLAPRMDEMLVPRDNKTRKRISSAVINRNRGKLWVHSGKTRKAVRRRGYETIWVRT
jgi:hypothetical protein